jgi:thioredoxin 1
MKRAISGILILITLIFYNCSSGKSDDKIPGSVNDPAVIQLSGEMFKKLIFNYELNKEWKFEGNKPVMIDFYADWCPPCRQLSPLVEEIAKEYYGKIVVYKVNSDKEKSLVQSLGIANLPTLLYIPVRGKPKVTLGAIPKEKIVKTIKEVLIN